jgi:hypothetical protein
MGVLVQRRAEPMDEGHRAGSRLGTGPMTGLAQVSLDCIQDDAQSAVEPLALKLEGVAQTLGHGEHPLGAPADGAGQDRSGGRRSRPGGGCSMRGRRPARCTRRQSGNHGCIRRNAPGQSRTPGGRTPEIGVVPVRREGRRAPVPSRHGTGQGEFPGGFAPPDTAVCRRADAPGRGLGRIPSVGLPCSNPWSSGETVNRDRLRTFRVRPAEGEGSIDGLTHRAGLIRSIGIGNQTSCLVPARFGPPPRSARIAAEPPGQRSDPPCEDVRRGINGFGSDPMPRTDDRLTPPTKPSIARSPVPGGEPSSPARSPMPDGPPRLRPQRRSGVGPLARTRLPRPHASAPQALDAPASRSAANRRPGRHRPWGAHTRFPAGAPESRRGPGRRPDQARRRLGGRLACPNGGRVTPRVLGPPGPPIPRPPTF